MSDFDAAGGPWGYRLRPNFTVGDVAIDAYLEAGYVTGAPVTLEGTIRDQSIYVGPMSDGETLLQRMGWYNQGAQYRVTVANLPAFPTVAVVDAYHLYALNSYLPEVVVQAGGTIDLAPLLPLLTNPAITSDTWLYRPLLALLGAAAATATQRDALASALALSADARATLLAHGVLMYEYNGTFTAQDHAAIRTTLALFPDPVKRRLHLIALDDGIVGAVGGYSSGGIITLVNLGTGLATFLAYPSGRQLPSVDSWQAVLTHEIGHLCDAGSVLYEADRWETIWAAGVGDPDAQLYGSLLPPTVVSEDIIFYFLGYCTDSATILGEVAARGNAVLTRKLSHVIDLLPSVTPGTVPFFTTDPTTHVTTTSTVPATRGPAAYLGDDGMITSVNGIVF